MQRNVVNTEAVEAAIARVMEDYGLHKLSVAPGLVAGLRRAVLEHDEAWQGVRKRRSSDPEWVAERLQQGVRLSRFKQVPLEVEALACELEEDLKAVLALADGREPELQSATARAKHCVDRLPRYALSKLAREASLIKRSAQSERFNLKFRQAIAPDRRIAGTEGRVWRRVRSLRHLDAIGRRYRNCLSRSRGEQYRDYWQRMLDGELEFWALFPTAARTGQSIAVATIDTSDDTLDEVEGVRTRNLSCAYRDDVIALMRARALKPDWTFGVVDMGIVPEMVPAPVEPSGTGRTKGVPWRVFRFERSLMVERGGDRPACAILDLETDDAPKRMEDVRAGGLLKPRPTARILARYARKVPVIDPVLGRILALALREVA